MDVMVLKRHLKGVQPFNSSDMEMTPEQNEMEMNLILGGDLDGESRDRELKAHVDRIKILEIELQRSRAEAYQAGYDEGQKITLGEAQKQFSQMTQEFTQNLHSLHADFTETIDHLTEPIIKLSMGAAEKLIERELNQGDVAKEILLTQVKRVLNETISQTRATVHVNTSQLEWITGTNILNSLNLPKNSNLRFIPNPTIKPGECKLETEDFLVDSTIHAQLENLAKVLKESDASDYQQI